MQHLAWGDAELFLTLLRMRSLRTASASLGLDVSTVSRKLTALEERLGVHLFDRSRTGVLPTPLALELKEAAEAMEHAGLELERRIERFEQHVAGTVRISVPPTVGDLFVARLLAGLREAHPAIDLVMDVSNDVADIQHRRADLAIRLFRPATGDLVSRKLGRLPHRVLAHPDHVDLGAPVRHWAALPWIVAETGPLASALTAVAPERAVLTTDSIPAQLAAVRAGLGVALLPTLFAKEFQLGALRGSRASPEPTWPDATLWLVGHVAQRRVPRIRALTEWLAARVSAVLMGVA